MSPISVGPQNSFSALLSRSSIVARTTNSVPPKAFSAALPDCLSKMSCYLCCGYYPPLTEKAPRSPSRCPPLLQFLIRLSETADMVRSRSFATSNRAVPSVSFQFSSLTLLVLLFLSGSLSCPSRSIVSPLSLNRILGASPF